MTISTATEPVSGSVTSRDGTRIAYDQRGSGPAVILVGGAFSDRGWRGEVDLAEALADRFTTVTYDRRGRGDSVVEGPVYDPALEIQDLEALIERFGARYLYGMSSGGVLVLHALAAGVGVGKAAVYEPPFVSGDLPPADYAERLRELVAREDPKSAAGYFLKSVMGVPAIIVRGMRVTAGWKRAVRLAPSLPYDAAVLGDFGVPATFGAIGTPVLAIGGGKSPAKLLAGLGKVTSVVPGSRSVVLDGQNHDPKPHVLAPVVADFFLSA